MSQRRPLSAPTRRPLHGTDRPTTPPHGSTAHALNSTSPVLRTSGRSTRDREYAHLKQAVLSSLTKLNDRDTQKTAVDELIRIAEGLDADGLAAFLGCLFDSTDENQRAIVRREVVRVFSMIIKMHPSIVVPLLPKMFARVTKQLKDQDSNLRDASADTIGTIASNIASSVSQDEDETGSNQASTSTLSIASVYRHLFSLFGEQNKNQQMGAAAAIRKVIQNTEQRIVQDIPMLSPKLVKLISQPACLARPQIILVASALIDVAGDLVFPYLNALIGSFIDSLNSEEWALRKSAAEALGTCALKLPRRMAQYKESVINALEKHRFDKIKPVRDAVTESTQIYRSIDDNLAAELSPVARELSPTSQQTLSKDRRMEIAQESFMLETSPTNRSVLSEYSVTSGRHSPPSLNSRVHITDPESESRIQMIIEQQKSIMHSLDEMKRFMQTSIGSLDQRLQKLEGRMNVMERRKDDQQILEGMSMRSLSSQTNRLGADLSNLENISMPEKTEPKKSNLTALDVATSSAVERDETQKIHALFSSPDFDVCRLHPDVSAALSQYSIRLLKEGRDIELATSWIRRFIENRYSFSLNDKTELTKIFRQYSLLSTPQGVEATRIYALLMRYSFDVFSSKSLAS